MLKLIIIVQARRASSRFRDKVLLPVLGKPVILRMLERVKSARFAKHLVVATTNNTEDDLLVSLCQGNDVNVFRGSETDLLDRHYQCAKSFGADIIVKIPSDCPLIDPNVIDKVIEEFIDTENDYTSNLHPATYPDGNDVEVFSMKALSVAWNSTILEYEREHTTPYFWENPGLFTLRNVVWDGERNYSMSHRFTLDYPEDGEFIKCVYENLYPSNPNFELEDILYLLANRPDIYKINDRYAGVNWYRNHLHQLRTISEGETKIIS